MAVNGSLTGLHPLTSWLKIVLFNFLVAALIGASMRFAFIMEIPGYNYRNFLHAHSHVALLGWLFGAFFILVIHTFQLPVHRYKRLFWLLQVSVFGMLIAFPLQGYGLFSIFFSTAHIILSYVFIARVYKDIKGSNSRKRRLSEKLLFTSLFFLFLASIGTWGLGLIMNSSLKGTAWYYAAIQFFLHFEFNGWFVFVVVALFLRAFSGSVEIVITKGLKLFYYLLVISCFLTYALAITWSNPENILFWTNSLGVILQLAAWIYFCIWIWNNKVAIQKTLTPEVFTLWHIAFLCLTGKIVIQALVAIPSIAIISYTIHNFVIGFIHLLMLGCLSIFIFGYLKHINIWTHKSGLLKYGIWIFIVGIGLSEALLFYQGIRLWMEIGFISNYYILIFLFSLLLPIGVGLYWLGALRTPGAAVRHD